MDLMNVLNVVKILPILKQKVLQALFMARQNKQKYIDFGRL